MRRQPTPEQRLAFERLEARRARQRRYFVLYDAAVAELTRLHGALGYQRVLASEAEYAQAHQDVLTDVVAQLAAILTPGT